MAADEEAMMLVLVKAAGKQGVKQGALAMDLPEDVARFLASQLSFTVDLLKKGANLTPSYLGVLLAQRSLALAGLAVPQRFDCAVAASVLVIALGKSVFMTTIAGPGHYVFTATELLVEVFNADKVCGATAYLSRKVEALLLPAAIWLDQGVKDWLMHPQ